MELQAVEPERHLASHIPFLIFLTLILHVLLLIKERTTADKEDEWNSFCYRTLPNQSNLLSSCSNQSVHPWTLLGPSSQTVSLAQIHQSCFVFHEESKKLEGPFHVTPSRWEPAACLLPMEALEQPMGVNEMAMQPSRSHELSEQSLSYDISSTSV